MFLVNKKIAVIHSVNIAQENPGQMLPDLFYKDAKSIPIFTVIEHSELLGGFTFRKFT